MPDATFYANESPVSMTVAAAAAAGEMRQLANGLAGFLNRGNGAAILDPSVPYQTTGQVTLAKTTSVVFLDGGRAFWDFTNAKVNYKQGDNQDFEIGSFVGDAASGDTVCTVNLNVAPRYKVDLQVGSFTPTLIGTPDESIFLRRRGGAQLFVLDATNEAQKSDALSDDGISTVANGIVEGRVKVVADDSGTAGVFSLGLASGTHATAFTSIANSIGIQVKAHDGKIYAESKTAGVTVAPTDTTVTYTVGTWFEFWIDTRNPAACAIYINGVRVLSGTVFDISACAVTLYLLAHLVKTAAADTMQVSVRDVRARIAKQ